MDRRLNIRCRQLRRFLKRLIDLTDTALQSERVAPLVVADLVTAILTVRPDAEPLAWTMADMLIAILLKWDRTGPLMMSVGYFQPITRAELSKIFGKDVFVTSRPITLVGAEIEFVDGGDPAVQTSASQ